MKTTHWLHVETITYAIPQVQIVAVVIAFQRCDSVKIVLNGRKGDGMRNRKSNREGVTESMKRKTRVRKTFPQTFPSNMHNTQQFPCNAPAPRFVNQ